MQKIVYLHMGFHKTATTSFQLSCYENNPLLNDQGIEYLAFNCYKGIRKKTSNHTPAIVTLFSNDLKNNYPSFTKGIPDIAATKQYYKEQLDAALASSISIIISGEGIPKLSIEELTKLKDTLLQSKATLIPFCVVRSPYEFHCSAAQQRVSGGNHAVFHQFNSQVERIEKVKKVFPNISFYSFRTACKFKDGPTNFLLHQLGIDNKNFKFINKNEGQSNQFVRAQNIFNNIESRVQNKTRNKNYIRLKEIEGDKFYLTKNEFYLIEQDLQKENSYFEQVFGKEFCDNEIKFSEPFNLEQFIKKYYFYVNWTNAQPKPKEGSDISNQKAKLQSNISDKFGAEFNKSPRPKSKNLREWLSLIFSNSNRD